MSMKRVKPYKANPSLPNDNTYIILKEDKPIRTETFIRENSFIYFGALFQMAKIYKFMKTFKDNDVYSWICEHNLQYRRLGSIRTNWQVIIGREIRVINGNPYLLDLERSYEELDKADIEKYKLTYDQESNVKWNLFKAGITHNPKYYITYNQLLVLNNPSVNSGPLLID